MDLVEFWKNRKRCKCCGQVKEYIEFYEKADTHDGYAAKCKQCTRDTLNAKRRSDKMAETATVIPRAPHQSAKKGFLYVITNPAFPNYYKIGVTGDPQARLSTFNTGDPHRAYSMVLLHPTHDRISLERTVLSPLRRWLDSSTEWLHFPGTEEQFLGIVKHSCACFDAATAPPDADELGTLPLLSGNHFLDEEE